MGLFESIGSLVSKPLNGLAGGLLGGSVKGSNKLEQQKLQAVLQALGNAKLDVALGAGRAQTLANRSRKDITSAFDEASENTRYLADQNRAEILKREPAALTGASMAVGRSGWGNSNLSDLSQRGVRGDTTRALLELERLTGGTLNELALGKAGALSDVNSQLAGFESQGTGLLAGLGESAAEAYGSTGFKNKPGVAELIQALGPIIGAAAGAAF